ncbi:MAG TPA: ComEC/Rec2 family competence protein [Anaerolineae bacterium]|nr:ComEC/Rec2 family competence protein [Anaerolineae bacterium]
MPLVPIGLGWLIGIWAAFTFALSSTLLFIALLVPCAGIVLWRAEPRARLAWLALLAALLGALRTVAAQPTFDADDLATYNDRGRVTLIGVVDDDPDRRDTFVNLRVRAETLAWPDADPIPIHGLVLVHADRLTEFRYGDRLEVIGPLQTPPEFATFNYRDYLAGAGVYSIIDRPRIERVARDQGSALLAALFDLKARARATIAAILPEPQAALLTGILLGDDAGLPPSVKDDFRFTGTSHIIAISGYNFSILIAMMSVPAVRLFGRRRAFPILLLAVFAYTVLVGASASVVRAAIMGALVLTATYLGRQTAALNSLFIAAFGMTLLEPFTLGDIGFQLSFAATLGLVLYTRPLQALTERGLTRLLSAFGSASRSASRDASYKTAAKKFAGVLSDAVIVTLAAQITTLPVLIITFRQLSILTLLVNGLVLPAQSGVMVFGGLALLVGLALLPLGQVVGWLAWLFLTWTLQVIHLFAQAPGVSIALGYVDPLWGVAYVAALAGITFYVSRSAQQRTEIQQRMTKMISLRFALPALVIVGLWVGLALAWQPDGKLHVHALNVDGLPAFVQTPSGRQILIGGSNSPSALLAALGARMPFWDRELDLLVVTRDDVRALNGLLAVVDRYQVGTIVSVEIGDSRAGREWLDMLAAKQLAVIEAGLGIGIEDGVSLSSSRDGWVRIEAGATSVGIGRPRSDSRVDVLLVAEVTDDVSAWLESAQPSIVVACGAVEAPEGMAVVDTEQNAAELLFDGARWEVKAQP